MIKISLEEHCKYERACEPQRKKESCKYENPKDRLSCRFYMYFQGCEIRNRQFEDLFGKKKVKD